MSSASEHVPAWKRLGLKLKYAKDEAPQVAATVETSGRKRRKLSPPPDVIRTTSDSPAQQVAAAPVVPTEKREKRSKKSSKSESSKSVSKELSRDDPNGTDDSLDAEGSKRRKSVTFTDDTKVEDGQSSKDLYRQWTENEAAKSDPGSMPEALQVLDGNNATKPVKKPKKAKKSKSTLLPRDSAKTDSSAETASEDASNGTHVSPLVEYLETYHKDREHWKFSKARQNHVFKHMLDLDKLPPSVNGALIAYIEGLKSEPVRARLRQDAKKGLEQSEKASQDVSQAKGDKNERSAKAREDNTARVARSEKIIEALGEAAPESLQVSAPKRENVNGQNKTTSSMGITTANGSAGTKRKRKRKRRTDVDDSSSSDDSSSDDSDADKPRKEKKSKVVAADDGDSRERAALREDILKQARARGDDMKKVEMNMEKLIDIAQRQKKETSGDESSSEGDESD